MEEKNENDAPEGFHFGDFSINIQDEGDRGNAHFFKITCTGDQFELVSFEKIKDGFSLALFGFWEKEAFIKAIKKHYSGNA